MSPKIDCNGLLIETSNIIKKKERWKTDLKIKKNKEIKNQGQKMFKESNFDNQ